MMRDRVVTLGIFLDIKGQAKKGGFSKMHITFVQLQYVLFIVWRTHDHGTANYEKYSHPG